MGRRANAARKRGREVTADTAPDKRLGQRSNGEGSWVDTKDDATFDNAAFEKYYRGAIIPDGEWEAFHSSMKTPLPSCLRFNHALAKDVRYAARDIMLGEFKAGEVDPQLHQWMEGGLSFQIGMNRGELKRSLEAKRAKKLAIALNETGFLSRQETVSMIPALFLDVQPGNTVADLCSAPGSKTTQLLEYLTRHENETANSTTPSAMASAESAGGCVVANDVNAGRLDILNHQTGRIPRAQDRLIITRHDAVCFPLTAEKKFDRILCDVMCSGDGTLRKSVDQWGRWNATEGPALHQQQCGVLKRGMSLCKKGGIVVYSTCSLNPIEDEAVVYQCLKDCGDCFELIDTSDMYPELKRYKGRTTWRVTSRDATEEYATAEEAKEKSGKFQKYVSSMWPPTEEEAKAAHLERCMPVPPHLQDTGGFFVAALRCKEEYTTKKMGKKEVKPIQGPMQPLSDKMKETVRQLFGLKDEDNFPFDQVYSRGETARQVKLYFINKGCDELMKASPGLDVQQAGSKIIEAGTRHQLGSLKFCNEGAETLASFLSARYLQPFPFAALQQVLSNTEGWLSLAVFKELLGDCTAPEPLKYPPQFLLRVQLPRFGGWMHLPASFTPNTTTTSSDGCVKIRITDQQKILFRYLLGEEIVEVQQEKENEEGGEDSSPNDDVEESAPEKAPAAAE